MNDVRSDGWHRCGAMGADYVLNGITVGSVSRGPRSETVWAGYLHIGNHIWRCMSNRTSHHLALQIVENAVAAMVSLGSPEGQGTPEGSKE